MKGRYRDEDNPHLKELKEFDCGYYDHRLHCHNAACDYWAGADCVLSLPGEGYEQGFIAAEKLYGWHKNCAETPVPKNTGIEITVRISEEKKPFYDNDTAIWWDEKKSFYLCARHKWVTADEVTHWREIPEIEE